MTLKTEQDTPEMRDRVDAAFKAWDTFSTHPEAKPVYEHSQWYVSCDECGAQWSVHDAEGGDSVDGFCFEEVSSGDGFCEERDDERDEEEPEEEYDDDDYRGRAKTPFGVES